MRGIRRNAERIEKYRKLPIFQRCEHDVPAFVSVFDCGAGKDR